MLYSRTEQYPCNRRLTSPLSRSPRESTCSTSAYKITYCRCRTNIEIYINIYIYICKYSLGDSLTSPFVTPKGNIRSDVGGRNGNDDQSKQSRGAKMQSPEQRRPPTAVLLNYQRTETTEDFLPRDYFFVGQRWNPFVERRDTPSLVDRLRYYHLFIHSFIPLNCMNKDSLLFHSLLLTKVLVCSPIAAAIFPRSFYVQELRAYTQ